jgi:hypothetical protein
MQEVEEQNITHQITKVIATRVRMVQSTAFACTYAKRPEKTRVLRKDSCALAHFLPSNVAAVQVTFRTVQGIQCSEAT